MGETINVLSVLQVLGHPRDSKRISMLRGVGMNVTAAAFERSYHSGRLPDCKIKKLGQIENGKYFKRLFILLKAIPKLRREIRKNDVIYASGQDMAAISFLAGLGMMKPIILEVGDIVEIQLSKSLLGKIVRAIERFFVVRYKLLVVISPGFLDVYYRSWLKIEIPALLLENKLEPSVVKEYPPATIHKQYTPFKDGPLRIGYFGLLRDEWSFNVLSQLAIQNQNKVSVVFAGMLVNPIDLEDKIKGYSNMQYLGEYKSPSDLPSLYSQVDMVWACYSHIKINDWNLRWGRPNRFFESCYYNKPNFARQGAHFTNDVMNYNIGKVITKIEIGETINEILDITESDYATWVDNIQAMPSNRYLYENEAYELKVAIKKMLKT